MMILRFIGYNCNSDFFSKYSFRFFYAAVFFLLFLSFSHILVQEAAASDYSSKYKPKKTNVLDTSSSRRNVRSEGSRRRYNDNRRYGHSSRNFKGNKVMESFKNYKLRRDQENLTQQQQAIYRYWQEKKRN